MMDLLNTLATKAGLHSEWSIDNPEIEIFAELILAECIKFCEEHEQSYFKSRRAAFEFSEKEIFAEGEAVSSSIKQQIKYRFNLHD